MTDISKEVKDAVLKKVGSALTKGVNQQYVEELRDRVVKRTRLGIGVSEDGTSEKLKPLADITKKVRKGEARIFSTSTGGKLVWTDGSDEKGISRKSKKTRKESFQAFFGKPRLSSTTRPNKSNLTATGQLLKSLTVVKIKTKNLLQFKIVVGDNRGRDMFGESSKIGNKELVTIQEKLGRRFLGFTKPQRNEVRRDIRAILKKFLK